MQGSEFTEFSPIFCETDDRWMELQYFSISEYELAKESDLRGQLEFHFNFLEISQFEAVEKVYAERELKLYTRTVSSWDSQCQANQETSKARFFSESNTVISEINDANQRRSGKINRLYEYEKSHMWPLMFQILFISVQAISSILIWGVGCWFDTSDWRY